MSEVVVKMEKAVESTQREFVRIRAGHASPAILNDVMVDYYGTPTPIAHVANVTAPEPRTLLVSPWEKGMAEEVEKAILAANIGITPMRDGHSIRCSLPILTQERRQELVKLARKHAEDGRVAIRNIRRDANDHLKKQSKEESWPEDQLKKEQEQVQKWTDQHIALVEEMLQEKEADLMKV